MAFPYFKLIINNNNAKRKDLLMEYLMNKVQSEYGFSDYQIKLIRFSFTGILYDVSKTVIFLIFFYVTGKFWEFMFAAVPLILLRTRAGGIHFHKYWTCFLFSFVYLLAAVSLLPDLIVIHPLAVYPILLACAVADYMIGAVNLKESLACEEESILTHKMRIMKRAKIQSFQVVCLVAVLIFIFPDSRYLVVSFWTVVLHTLQLSIKKLIKEVKCYEKLA